MRTAIKATGFYAGCKYRARVASYRTFWRKRERWSVTLERRIVTWEDVAYQGGFKTRAEAVAHGNTMLDRVEREPDGELI